MLCRAAVLIFGLSFAVQAQMNFNIQPMSVVQAEGLDSMFECLYSREALYLWIVDGVSSTSSNFSLEAPTGGVGGEPSVLTIPATDQYNGSVVLCRAVSGNGDFPSETSENANLTVLEISVVSIINSTDTITLLWNNDGFTTNISYCVEIDQTMLGSSETVPLDPMCGLTGPEYTFLSPGHSLCDRFSFTVTPTEGDMRGKPSEPVTGFFTRATGTGGEICAVDDGFNETETVIFQATVPNCANFISHRVDSDLLSVPITGTLESLARSAVTINFTLPADQNTNVNVTLTDTSGVDLVFESIETSTLDIKNITAVPCPDNCSLCVTVEYIEGSDAGGALVCAMPMINGQPNLEDMILVSIRRDNSQNFTIPVPPGTYEVLAFDIESNNLPRMPLSVAAVSIKEPVQVCGDDMEPTESPSDDSGITSTKLSNGVEVTCPNMNVSCLILVQSTTDPNRANIGLIRPGADRTITVEFTGILDDSVFVLVYTWNSINNQSIFDGQFSHISLLEPPTTPAPTTTTTLGTIPSINTPGGVRTLSEGAIAGVVIIVVVLLLVLLVAIVLVVLVLHKKKNMKVQLKPDNTYNRIESNSEGVPTNGASRELDLGAPVGLYDVITADNMAPEQDTACTDSENLPGAYDVVRKENMASPNYETIESAKASMSATTTPTTDELPPLPPPKITEEKDAPPLPPAYNPRIDSSTELLATVDSVEEPQAIQESGPLGEEPVVAADEPVDEAEDTLERRTKKQVQYTMVHPNTSPSIDTEQRLDPTKVIYAEVDKGKLKPKSHETEIAPALPPPLCTADSVRAELHSLAGKWEDLAKALNVDEDRIDEIFTNSENDQLRLHDLVEYYFQNVHYSHTWEEIVQTVRNIGEHGVADRISRDKVQESVEPPQYSSVV